MPNHDRVSEGYRGEVWNAETQKAVRERIHWMCGQADGRVLDLGCSQGIASIIIGREGLPVSGVDHEISRLIQARHDLAQEDSWVAGRVLFLAAEGRDLPFADGTFQTVLLGEVLEHLVLPHLLLDEVVRVLAPGGRLVVTTPVGYHPFHDHKASFYPASLGNLVGRHLRVETIEITDRYVWLTARRDEPGCPSEIILGAQEALEAYMVDVERRQVALREQLRESKNMVGALRRRVARDEEEHAARLAELEESQAQLEQSTGISSAEVADRLAQQVSRVSELTEQRDRLKERVDQLAASRAEVAARLERMRFWRQAEASSRSYRMGREIADAWPHPGKILALPWRLFRVLTTPLEAPPDPSS